MSVFELRIREHNCMCGAPCGRGLREKVESAVELLDEMVLVDSKAAWQKRCEALTILREAS